MPVIWLILTVLILAFIASGMARFLTIRSAEGDRHRLHSRPLYYGTHAALAVMAPAFLLMVTWLVIQPIVISATVSGTLPQDLATDSATQRLVMSDVKRLAGGLDLAVAKDVMSAEEVQTITAEGSDLRARLGDIGVALGNDVQPQILTAAQDYRSQSHTGRWIMTGVVLLVALIGFAYAYMTAHKDFRARTTVERFMRVVLIAAASVAVLTTIGIFFALIFNTVEFFRMYPWTEYLLGTTWQPHSGSGVKQPLGLLPLLWGTLYISIIALLVAVPVGLFAAIYLAEYASPSVRGIVKPLLEVLAGIPSIVYGLFALLIVGPLLLGIFGRGGFGIMEGASSVMTAGLVMGIMLIPFVCSLSDDIINAVPQAMRDGSLGLGATPSETIRQVVLPAALPGIVGAIILAASRAIGETMLVVFGAGAAGRLSMNPFEAMTTVTAKIVSQLTGDSDFTQPEVLVAYALGTTLFVVTLCLNVLAQFIVNKYREQYQ